MGMLSLQEDMDPWGMSEHRKNETKQNIVPLSYQSFALRYIGLFGVCPG